MSVNRALAQSRAYKEFSGWVSALPTRNIREVVPEAVVVEVQPVLLNVEQAAQYLSVGRTEIFKMIAEERIRSIKRGRRRLVPRAELDRYVSEEVARAQKK